MTSMNNNTSGYIGQMNVIMINPLGLLFSVNVSTGINRLGSYVSTGRFKHVVCSNREEKFIVCGRNVH